jgi:hypothetical protein
MEIRPRRPALGATLLSALACAACAPGQEAALVLWQAPPAAAQPQDFHVPAPPFSAGVFPCTDCHDPEIPVNTRRRELATAHTDIRLRHDEEHRWCLDCHDAGNRDVLHLAGGELVPFEESYRLCGQCHGDKYRDWRAGVHGRRTGRWDGEKSYLLCVHCHDSHAPRFKPLAPLPPPIPPRRTP